MPGISDHSIVITDMEIKPHYQKTKPRKCYIYAKANWDALKTSLSMLSANINTMNEAKENIHNMWGHFKEELKSQMDKHIPSKEIRSKE